MDLFKLVARLTMDSSEYERDIAKARGKFETLGSQISAKTIAIGNLMASGIKKAVDVSVNLGKSAIQNAADVTAEKAQFESTFKTLQGSAKKAFDEISKDTGIFGTRLQAVGTKAFSQFKGAGLEGVEALGMMKDYTTLAADAAAYYDITLEEADERLRSFLRGNTEAGDAIGLFTSESQRNSAAMEKYGAKWQALTEAQKQMLMLDISKDIYKQSGAIGQASRESDAWTNAIGNLKEAWRQATGTIGKPILETLTPILKKITDFFRDEEVMLKFDRFGLALGNIGNATFDSVNLFLDTLTGGKTDAKTAIDNIVQFFEDIGVFMTNHSEGITALISTVSVFFAVQNPAALLIGALALIVTNWNNVKTATNDAIEKTKDFFETVYQDKISPILEKVASWAGAVWDKISGAYNALLKFLGIGNDPNFKLDIEPNSKPGGNKYTSGGNTSTVGNYKPGQNLYLSGGSKGYATGLDYVPYNNFMARLHEGEAVLTRSEASTWRSREDSRSTGAQMTALLEELRSLREAILGSRAVMTPDGRVLGDIVTEQVSRNIAAGARRRG